MSSEDKKDYGLLNGVQSELISILAGAGSFLVFSDKIIAQLQNVFNISFETSMWIFFYGYFVAPFIIMLLWIGWYNHKDGLKQTVCSEWGNNWLHGTLFLLFNLLWIAVGAMIISWWDIPLLAFMIIGLFCFVLSLIYALTLLTGYRSKTGRYKYDSEKSPPARSVRQAMLQFVILGLVTIAAYISLIIAGHPCSNLKSSIHSSLVASNDAYKQYYSLDSTIKKIRKENDSLATVKNLYSHFRDKKNDSLIKGKIDNLQLSVFLKGKKLTDFNIKWPDSASISKSKIFSIPPQKKVAKNDTDMYISYKILNLKLANLKERAQEAQANYLNSLKSFNLIIECIFILFFLCVWYHAFSDSMLKHPASYIKEAFSEVGISRMLACLSSF